MSMAISDLQRAHDDKFLSIRELLETCAESEQCTVGKVAKFVLRECVKAKDSPRCIEREEPSDEYHVKDDTKELEHWLGVVATYDDFVADPNDEPENGYGYDPEWAWKKAEKAYRTLGWYRDEMVPFLEALGIELRNPGRTDDGSPSSAVTTGKSLIPDYLDPNHPQHAPKLAAAVQAWQAVTNDPERLRGKTPKQAITQYLVDHAKFGEAVIEDIARVANWEPRGGAPKTPG